LLYFANFHFLLCSNFSVVRNTRNPVYEEDFTFYGLTMIELQSMSLHFVVLSFDRYSRDDVIGEVVCPFNTIELHQIENQQVALSREIQPRSLKVIFDSLISF
jgi:synaptotagmin-4